jgi:hypothetical protein
MGYRLPIINLNLPPEERVKVENIMASMVIPGPQKPKELDTFLQPLVEELKRLDRDVQAYEIQVVHSTLKPG